MDPQEGDIARGPNGETAVFQGGQWVVQAQGQQGAGWQVQQFQSPADRRAEEQLNLSRQSNERANATQERIANQADTTLSRQGIQSESDLRDKFQALQDVKDFYIVSGAYRNVAATASNESAAGDLSLIFAYMKMLDPTSAVRETEFANAQNAAGVPDQIRNLFNRIKNGERLNPDQRADFTNQARSLYQNSAARYQDAADFYTGLASDYGFDPGHIVRPISDPMAQEAQDPTAPTSPQARQQDYRGPAADLPPLPRNPDGTISWEGLTGNQQTQLQKGDRVRLPSGEVVILRGAPIVDESQRGSDREASPGVFLREPNMLDSAGAFSMAAAEQVPFLDEAVAAADGAISGDGYSAAYQRQNDLRQSLNQTNRGERIAGGIAGAGLMTAATGGVGSGYLAGGRTALQAAGRGAMVGAGSGAVYGAGATDGGLRERAQGAVNGAVAGALTGAALNGGARYVGNSVSMTAQPGSRAAHVQTLRNNGVSMTPGQRMGGLAQTAENLAQRAPILGTAIRGARERGRDSLNRAVGNRALDAIGEGVPANINPGGEMVSHVQGRLGAEFDRAYSMVPQLDANDPALVAGLTRIGQAKADLPPAMREQFDSIVSERLSRLQGAATGQNVGAVRSELNNIASGYLRSQDPAQQTLGKMLAELGDELDGAISRASPEAGDILARARDGYADYIRLERASTNAGGEAFSPGQLASAVKATDGTVRHGGIGRGGARLQDLSRAAKAVLPDQFGNPGTADAGAAIGLAGLTAANPAAGAATVGGLTAAATPYFLMGRQVLDRLPAAASRQQLEAAAGEIAQLARQDPKVIILQDEIAKRLSAASGQAAQQVAPRLMTQPTR